jgi:hypothetical protein
MKDGFAKPARHRRRSKLRKGGSGEPPLTIRKIRPDFAMLSS